MIKTVYKCMNDKLVGFVYKKLYEPAVESTNEILLFDEDNNIKEVSDKDFEKFYNVPEKDLVDIKDSISFGPGITIQFHNTMMSCINYADVVYSNKEEVYVLNDEGYIFSLPRIMVSKSDKGNKYSNIVSFYDIMDKPRTERDNFPLFSRSKFDKLYTLAEKDRLDSNKELFLEFYESIMGDRCILDDAWHMYAMLMVSGKTCTFETTVYKLNSMLTEFDIEDRICYRMEGMSFLLAMVIECIIEPTYLKDAQN